MAASGGAASGQVARWVPCGPVVTWAAIPWPAQKRCSAARCDAAAAVEAGGRRRRRGDRAGRGCAGCGPPAPSRRWPAGTGAIPRQGEIRREAMARSRQVAPDQRQAAEVTEGPQQLGRPARLEARPLAAPPSGRRTASSECRMSSSRRQPSRSQTVAIASGSSTSPGSSTATWPASTCRSKASRMPGGRGGLDRHDLPAGSWRGQRRMAGKRGGDADQRAPAAAGLLPQRIERHRERRQAIGLDRDEQRTRPLLIRPYPGVPGMAASGHAGRSPVTVAGGAPGSAAAAIVARGGGRADGAQQPRQRPPYRPAQRRRDGGRAPPQRPEAAPHRGGEDGVVALPQVEQFIAHGQLRAGRRIERPCSRSVRSCMPRAGRWRCGTPAIEPGRSVVVRRTMREDGSVPVLLPDASWDELRCRQSASTASSVVSQSVLGTQPSKASARRRSPLARCTVQPAASGPHRPAPRPPGRCGRSARPARRRSAAALPEAMLMARARRDVPAAAPAPRHRPRRRRGRRGSRASGRARRPGSPGPAAPLPSARAAGRRRPRQSPAHWPARYG